jgi:hypothetical protein
MRRWSYIKPYVIRRWVGLAAAIDLIRIQRGGKPDWERGGTLAAHMLPTSIHRAVAHTVRSNSLDHVFGALELATMPQLLNSSWLRGTIQSAITFLVRHTSSLEHDAQTFLHRNDIYYKGLF